MNRKIGIFKIVRNNYFSRFIYLTILVIILIIPLYITAINTNRKIAENNLLGGMSERLNSLKDNMAEIQNYSSIIIKNDEILRLSLLSNDSNDLDIALYNANNQMQNNIWDFKLIEDVHIQFSNNNTLVTQSGVYWEKEWFYNNYMACSEMDYSQWQQMLFCDNLDSIGPIDIIKNSVSTNEVVYLNYYSKFQHSPHIIICFVLSTDTLFDYLLDDDIRQYGSFTFTHNLGNSNYVITYEGANDQERSRQYSFVSNQSDMSVQLSISEKFFTDAIRPIERLLLLYILAFFLLTTGFALLFTKQSTRSLRPLLEDMAVIKNLTESMENLNRPEQIFENLRQVLKEIHLSKEDIVKQNEQINMHFRNSIINMLVHGIPVQPSDLNVVKGDIEVLQGKFHLIGMKMLSSGEEGRPVMQEWAVAKRFIQELLSVRRPDTYYFEQNIQYAIVSIGDEPSDKDLVRPISEIRNTMKRMMDIDINCGISLQMDDPALLYEAMEQVAFALSEAQKKDCPKVVQYTVNGLPKLQPTWSSTNEEQLRHLVISDDQQSLVDFFNHILETFSFSQHDCDFRVQLKMSYYCIISALQRLAAEYGADSIYPLEEYRKQLSIIDNIRHLQDKALLLQDRIQKDRVEQDDQINKDLLDYVHNNYSNPLFCLSYIADEFNITERNVSKRILQMTGLHYCDYINNLRMNQSKLLLTQTNLSISQIADQVGYDKLNSFYRIFKQHIGVPPKKYRDQHGRQIDIRGI